MARRLHHSALCPEAQVFRAVDGPGHVYCRIWAGVLFVWFAGILAQKLGSRYMECHLLVTKICDGWACTDNQKLELETTEATHSHDKRQPTNAGQLRCMSHKRQPPNQATVHASNQETLRRLRGWLPVVLCNALWRAWMCMCFSECVCLVLVPAGVLCLCRTDRTMPIGPVS